MYLNVSPQFSGFLDLCDFVEVLIVWNAKGAHAVLVPPLLEVPLELPSASVCEAPTNFAGKLLQVKAESVPSCSVSI